MSNLKIISSVNWVLISMYGAYVVWALGQKANPYNDAGGGEMEIAIKGLGVFLLLVLIGLNVTSYQWVKIVAFVLVVLLLQLIRYITTH